MIVSIRGTNGAGKSHLVRALMSLYDTRKEEHRSWQRKPVGYVLHRRVDSSRPSAPQRPALFVVGHYEIANGGVDTLPNLDAAYDLIADFSGRGYDVVAEGKNMSDGPRRALALVRQGADLRVAVINQPLDKCIAAVRARGHRIRVETIERLLVKCGREYDKFVEAGVVAYVGDRASVERKVREWLAV